MFISFLKLPIKYIFRGWFPYTSICIDVWFITNLRALDEEFKNSFEKKLCTVDCNQSNSIFNYILFKHAQYNMFDIKQLSLCVILKMSIITMECKHRCGKLLNSILTPHDLTIIIFFSNYRWVKGKKSPSPTYLIPGAFV